MKPTVAYIEKRFDKFNKLMFNGILPRIPITLCDSGRFMGMCSSKMTRHPDGREEHKDFQLKINGRIEMGEREIEDVLIHEMIHYFVGYTGLQDSSTHGPIFVSIMNSINTVFKRELSVKHNTTMEQREALVDSRKLWHVIAAVYFKGGEVGVKVLPRVVEKVLQYYKAVGGNPQVERVDLYLHNNPFYNRFPTSSVLKVHSIEKVVMEENLKGAHRLRVSGNQLIQC